MGCDRSKERGHKQSKERVYDREKKKKSKSQATLGEKCPNR